MQRRRILWLLVALVVTAAAAAGVAIAQGRLSLNSPTTFPVDI